MTLAVPMLTPPRVMTPHRLRQVVANLGRQSTGPRREVTAELRAQAEKLVQQQLTAPTILPAPVRLVPALTEIATSSQDVMVRRAVIMMLLHAESIGWRRLWVLWQLTGSDGRVVVPTLATRIHLRARESDRFRENLPKWLPANNLNALEWTLLDPRERIREYFEYFRMPLTAWPADTELSDGGGVGQACLLHLARKGSDTWWRLARPSEMRTWAEAKKLLPLIAIVVDRQLATAFPHARGPADVRSEPELRVFASKHLGDPVMNPGRWDAVSPRSRQLFEWMLLADECQKIFAEFRRMSSHDERADYWERRVPRIHDALLYRAGDTAVCLMRIGRRLVVEFGTSGNACYFYEWPESDLRLRALRVPSRLGPSAFKSESGLSLGGLYCRYVRRLTHRNEWQGRFDDALERAR